MVAQRTITPAVVVNSEAVVHEAVRLLATKRTAQRWICEACGMIHTGTAPAACESCGKASALVQQAELHRELHSRW